MTERTLPACLGLWVLVLICFYLNMLSSRFQYHIQELPALSFHGKISLQSKKSVTSSEFTVSTPSLSQFDAIFILKVMQGHISCRIYCFFQENYLNQIMSVEFSFSLKGRREWRKNMEIVVFSMNSFHGNILLPTGCCLQNNFYFKPSNKKKGALLLAELKNPKRTFISDRQHSEVSLIMFFIKLLQYHRPD